MITDTVKPVLGDHCHGRPPGIYDHSCKDGLFSHWIVHAVNDHLSNATSDRLFTFTCSIIWPVISDRPLNKSYCTRGPHHLCTQCTSLTAAAAAASQVQWRDGCTLLLKLHCCSVLSVYCVVCTKCIILYLNRRRSVMDWFTNQIRNPLLKDHLFWATTCLEMDRWSPKTSFTV